MPTPPYVFPPFGNIPNTWVLFGDGHFGPVSGGGAGAAPEILVLCDTSTGNVTFTLPDPATLTDQKTIFNVKNINGGVYMLAILPGVAGTIDGVPEGIRTITNNQGYRFRLAETADTKLPFGIAPTGWVCIETVFGGDTGAAPTPPYIPGPCSQTLPDLGPGEAFDVQYFVGDGTWTRPANYIAGAGNLIIDALGAGAPGGTAQAGYFGGSRRNGGQGGGGGQRAGTKFNPADLPATVPVKVDPTGGTPGTGGGNSGTILITFPTDPYDTEFGNPGDPWHVIALSGKAGTTATPAGAGVGGPGLGGGGTPVKQSSTGLNGGGGGSDSTAGGGSQCGGPGGGVGGGANHDAAPEPGQAGGLPFSTVLGGGAAGGAAGYLSTAGDGQAGADGDIDTPGGGGGGGGGVQGGSYPVHAGKGGRGGSPGGGGGGGGFMGSSEGVGGNSGSGSNGALRVTTRILTGI